MRNLKLIFISVVAVVVVGMSFPAAVWAKSAPAKNPHATYAIGHAKKCKTGFIKRTERHKVSVTVKVSGKSVTNKVTRRYVACVWVVPKIVVPPATAAAPTATVPAPTSTTPTSSPTTTTMPVVTTVRASIDPSWVLAVKTPQPPPVPVTFSYSASAGAQALPTGELTLSIFVHDSVSSAGGCQANVGASVTSSSCTVDIPAWGSYDLITSYSSGVGNVAATGQTETVSIEPPALSAENVIETWGTTSPTNGAAVSATVTGFSAAVSITDSNFEGAPTIGVTDNLGDACTATVSGTTATCALTVSGTPSAFSLSYPGGINDMTTQTVSPWGTPESQTVTDEWPSDVVDINSPTVSVQSATMLWNGGHILNSGGGSIGTWSGAPSDPIDITAGEGVTLGAYASGSLAGDPYPLGTVAYVVGPTTGVTMTDDQPSGSTSCQGSQNYSGQAVGYCTIKFSQTGTYTISIGYVSSDSNYSSTATDALTETVIVS